jgi:hypothetical protein
MDGAIAAGAWIADPGTIVVIEVNARCCIQCGNFSSPLLDGNTAAHSKAHDLSLPVGKHILRQHSVTLGSQLIEIASRKPRRDDFIRGSRFKRPRDPRSRPPFPPLNSLSGFDPLFGVTGSARSKILSATAAYGTAASPPSSATATGPAAAIIVIIRHGLLNGEWRGCAFAKYRADQQASYNPNHDEHASANG